MFVDCRVYVFSSSLCVYTMQYCWSLLGGVVTCYVMHMYTHT